MYPLCPQFQRRACDWGNGAETKEMDERKVISRGLLLAGTPTTQHLATRMSPLAAAAMHGDVTKVKEILAQADLDGFVSLSAPFPCV